MNLVLHFFRKDLRLIRWPLLFLIIEALGVMLWYSMLPVEERADLSKAAVLPIWRYAIWAGCFIMIGGLTLRDAPLREGAFFRTRPVALSTLLLSKYLIALCIIVLFAMIESLSLLMLGLKPGALDFLLIFAEELLVLSALAAVSMAMAIRQETAGKYFANVAVWGGVLGVGWISFMWFKSSYFLEKPEWSYELEFLKLSRSLAAQFVTLAGAVVGMVLFVRSRRRETITKSLAFTAVCTIATLLCWPVNFVKAFAPAPREAPKNEWPDQSKLKFTFESQRTGPAEKSIFTYGDGEEYNGRYRRVQGYSSLKGLTDGWRAAFDNDYQSTLTLSNGKTISQNHKGWAELGWQAILPNLGIPNGTADIDQQTHQFELSKFYLVKAAGAMTGAHLRGTMEIPLKRPVILARIPFRQGVSIQLGTRRIDLTLVEFNLDEIRYTIIQQRPLLKLRGDWFNRGGGVVDFIVIHPSRREFLEKGAQSTQNNSSGHYSIELKKVTAPIWRSDYKKHPIPPDWAAGAELLVIGDENGGSFSQDFDFPSINLSNGR